ncbi:MAG: diphthine synthase [Candidatus Thermoplasmatota archaeon]|nr:diphthine synthase [Candidatus Thermoplasmatota archaeon]
MAKSQLTFVGLGLHDEHDLSLKGLQELSACDLVFAEFYTAKPGSFNKKAFETLIGKQITILTRQETEQGEAVTDAAKHHHVVFLTCGDPMIATTHIDLRLRAIQQGIPTRIIHSSSVATAVPGLLGLQNYKFGRTTTLAYPEKDYFPTSPYTVIVDNTKMGLHTLVLLDIQADQQRYMTANEGLELLLAMEQKEHQQLISNETLVCVVARAGAPDCVVAADTLKALKTRDFGPPLHTLVIPGQLHFMELEALQLCAGLPAEIAHHTQKL